jgi:hypothetical protein
MTGQDRKILIEFATRLRERYPSARSWAYGSRALADYRLEQADESLRAGAVLPQSRLFPHTDSFLREGGR